MSLPISSLDFKYYLLISLQVRSMLKCCPNPTKSNALLTTSAYAAIIISTDESNNAPANIYSTLITFDTKSN